MSNTPFLPLLLICAVATGCNHAMYAPNPVNLPMLGAKGDTTIAASRGERDSVTVSGGYSPVKGLGVLGTGYRSFQSEPYRAQSSFAEVGAGYYRLFRRRIVADGYGLLGAGHINTLFPPALLGGGGEFFNADSRRLGAQASLSFRSKFFDVSSAARVLRYTYRNVNGNTLGIRPFQDGGPQALFENVWVVQAGWDPVKFQIQFVNGSELVLTSLPAHFYFQGEGISIGVVFTRRNP